MSDKVNRLIQKASIDAERAKRLLEEMKVMDKEIERLRTELSTAYRRGREDMREEAAKVADDLEEDLYGRAGEAAASHIASSIRKLEA